MVWVDGGAGADGLDVARRRRVDFDYLARKMTAEKRCSSIRFRFR